MSTSEGPRCDVSIEGGSQTGYHGAGKQGDTGGPTLGEANTNIMSALSVGCNKTLYSNNNSDFRLSIYKYLHVLLRSHFSCPDLSQCSVV